MALVLRIDVVLVPWIVVVHLPPVVVVCRVRLMAGLMDTLTLSDLTPRHLEPEGQSAMLAGVLSPDRSAGGVCGAMRSRSSCGVPHGERKCNGLPNSFYINDLLCFTGGRMGSDQASGTGRRNGRAHHARWSRRRSLIRSILWSQVFTSAIRASVISGRLLVPRVLRLVRASFRLDIFVQHFRGAVASAARRSQSCSNGFRRSTPELVKIAHVAGHDRQPMHQGRRGDHGILQQGV